MLPEAWRMPNLNLQLVNREQAFSWSVSCHESIVASIRLLATLLQVMPHSPFQRQPRLTAIFWTAFVASASVQPLAVKLQSLQQQQRPERPALGILYRMLIGAVLILKGLSLVSLMSLFIRDRHLIMILLFIFWAVLSVALLAQDVIAVMCRIYHWVRAATTNVASQVINNIFARSGETAGEVTMGGISSPPLRVNSV